MPILVGVLLASCGGNPIEAKAPICTPAEIDALGSLYEAAALGVIAAGKCDGFARVSDCPAYLAVESAFTVSAEALCRGR